jgi:hypothetical protein
VHAAAADASPCIARADTRNDDERRSALRHSSSFLIIPHHFAAEKDEK